MNRRILLLGTLLCLLTACATPKHHSGSADSAYVLIVEGYFSHERVLIFADGVPVFSGRVTTDPTSGMARAIHIPYHSSRIHLRVETPATASHLERTVDLRRGRYLGLSRYAPRQALVLQQHTDLPLYD